MYKILKLSVLLFFSVLAFTSSGFATTFSLTSDTVGPPTTGIAVIDFIDGDGFDNSFATISNLSSPANFYDGSFTEPAPGVYQVDDSAFFSSLYIDLVDIYAGFSFDVDATFGDPGMFGFPDSLVVSIFDEFYSPLFSTTDPLGTDALMVMSFQGTDIYSPVGFSISMTDDAPVPTPEPGTFILLALGLGLFFLKRNKFANIGVSIFIFALCATPSQAAFEDVTNNVTITRSPLAYNRTTQTFDGLITITNNSTDTISSPMFLIVSDVPETVSVNSAASLSAEGYPIVNLPIWPEGLAPGQSISNFKIKFHNPSRARFTAEFIVMAGRGDLPPDPGAEGKASLAGVDANNNGVRDDVEIYIELNFSDTPKKKEGLNQLAHTVQNGIVASTEQESMQAASSQSRALECLEYIAPDDESWKEIETQAINTPERFNAWMAHQARLSGQVFPSRRLSDWKTSCEFDTDN
jgi:hypothetical protein